MAKQVYTNFQLRRTLPKLSGNMQIDVAVGFTGNNCYVEKAHLRPISRMVNYRPDIDNRITLRPHQLNIKDFYNTTRSQFYNMPIDPSLESDWPLMVPKTHLKKLKYIKNFDDTYHAGCQRMEYSLYGCTHEILVPVWLDWSRGLRFRVRITPYGVEKDYKEYTLDLSPVYLYGKQSGSWNYKPGQKFHNEFVKYLLDYLDYTSISAGNNRVLNIDVSDNLATLYGLNVESGNVQIRTDENLTRNLIYRERPLLEFNSALTNIFRDYKLIVPQLINFNICFDINKLLANMRMNSWEVDFEKYHRYNVYVQVDNLRYNADTDPEDNTVPNFETEKNYHWEQLGLGDFYTNHHYIPRIKRTKSTVDDASNIYYDDTPSNRLINTLEYKKDYLCTDLIHKNKMVQPICHWVYASSPLDDNLFNFYDGFSAYTTDSEGNTLSQGHGSGNVTNPTDTQYDPDFNNAAWTGAMMYGTGAQVVNNLLNPWDLVDKGYFFNTNDVKNGIQFNYNMMGSSEDAPREMYIGLMSTPEELSGYTWWNGTQTMIDTSRFIGILDGRLNASGKECLPETRKEITTPFDKLYDYYLHSDVDNRYAVRTKNDEALYYDPTGEILTPGSYVVGDVNPDDDATYDASDIVGSEVEGHSGELLYSLLQRIGGEGLPDITLRDNDNLGALFVCMLRVPQRGTTTLDKNSPLFVIFFHKQARLIAPKFRQIIHNNNGKGPDLSGLLLYNCIQALKDYYSTYKPISEVIENAAKNKDIEDPGFMIPDMDDLGHVVNTLASVNTTKVIFFNNTIVMSPDRALSLQAQEVNYYKENTNNSYVIRYDGPIKPAIFPDKFIRRSDTSTMYKGYYGRNFLWQKQMILGIGQSFPSNISRYINTHIPPTYPSLDYDPVTPMIIGTVGNGNKAVPCGDLVYDEVPPIFEGRTNNDVILNNLSTDDFNITTSTLASINVHLDVPVVGEPYIKEKILDGTIMPMLIQAQPIEIGYWLASDNYETYNHSEYKWFQKSVVTDAPNTIEVTISTKSNDKVEIEQVALEAIKEKLQSKNPVGAEYDLIYLGSIYDIKYNLCKIESGDYKRDGRTKNILYEYKYEIKATLK